MADSSEEDRLSRVRADLERLLVSYLGHLNFAEATDTGSRHAGSQVRTTFVSARRGSRVSSGARARQRAGDAGQASGVTGPTTSAPRRDSSSDGGMAADRSSGATSVRDERTLRALAKEIKHLISEDKRRGIGV